MSQPLSQSQSSPQPKTPRPPSKWRRLLAVLQSPYQKLPKLIRQFLMLLLGIPVIIIGIILLPLPGPGWLVILAGLYLISIEVEWARKYFNFVKSKLQQIYDKARAKRKGLGEEAGRENDSSRH